MLLHNSIYLKDVHQVCSMDLDWSRFQDKSFMISGSTGMIGCFFIDVLMEKNKEGLNCSIYALGRSLDKAKQRFKAYINNELFHFIECDISKTLLLDQDIDFVFHGASTTHPVAYASEPISTITTNIIGANNLLDFASSHNTKRFVLASSCEIYGENRGDVDMFDENYCGYINCNTLRAGYPESKRAAESLCQAYLSQKGLDVVIARLSRTFGPTMLMSDTKALSQFIKKGIASENIVLKSEGNQLYSYTYVADAVSGILTCFISGKTGEAYNVSDKKGNICLKDLAELIADITKKEVVFELPDEIERKGYSTATKAVQDTCKMASLGWHATFDMKTALEHTIECLKSI